MTSALFTPGRCASLAITCLSMSYGLYLQAMDHASDTSGVAQDAHKGQRRQIFVCVLVHLGWAVAATGCAMGTARRVLALTLTLTLTLALTPTLTLALTLAATKQLRERCPFADMKLCKETLRDYGCDVGLAAEALEANRVDRV